MTDALRPETFLPHNEQNMFQYIWEHRLDLLNRILANGETNLARVLGLMAEFNRHHRLILETCDDPREGNGAQFLTGRAAWVRETPDPGNRAMFPDCPVTPEGVPLYSWAVVGGHPTIRPSHASYDHLAVPVILALTRQRRFDAFAELGSGFGEKLFRLYLAGAPRDVPYYGAELWEGGRLMADALASLEPGIDFHGVTFDMKAPDFSFLAPHKQVLLFSNAAIYAVPDLPPDFLDLLLDTCPAVTGVHFEFIGYQLGVTSAYVEEFNRRREERAYNRDFIGLLRQAEEKGRVTVEYLQPDLYCVSSAQPVTVIVWRKT
ncbi:MAG: hypothetical protein AB1918_00930 [Pseudomonadota bacterium]